MYPECKRCKLSARCLPQGLVHMFEEVFGGMLLVLRGRQYFSKYELRTFRWDGVVADSFTKAYTLTGDKFPCKAIPWIRLGWHRHANLVSIQARFSLRRRIGYQHLQEMPLQLSLPGDWVR